MGEDTWTKGDVFVQVTFSEPITTEFELGGTDISQVSVENSQGIQFGNMVTANLIGANKELDLSLQNKVVRGV